jgi:cohesin complex subunit SCC1
LDDADDNETRQDPGDQIVSSSSKWHKHTVKVYNVLRSRMTDETPELSYQKLCPKSVSRRTAAGVFFELLQLKTWDIIDLGQDKSYADIMVRVCLYALPLLLVALAVNLLLFA